MQSLAIADDIWIFIRGSRKTNRNYSRPLRSEEPVKHNWIITSNLSISETEANKPPKNGISMILYFSTLGISGTSTSAYPRHHLRPSQMIIHCQCPIGIVKGKHGTLVGGELVLNVDLWSPEKRSKINLAQIRHILLQVIIQGGFVYCGYVPSCNLVDCNVCTFLICIVFLYATKWLLVSTTSMLPFLVGMMKRNQKCFIFQLFHFESVLRGNDK